VSISIAPVADAGRCLGWQPRAKVSMMIMRPPQQRHAKLPRQLVGGAMSRLRGVGAAFDHRFGRPDASRVRRPCRLFGPGRHRYRYHSTYPRRHREHAANEPVRSAKDDRYQRDAAGNRGTGAAAHVTIAKAGRRVDGRRADGRRPPRRQFEPGRPTLISPPGPVTIPRYAPFPVRGSVHLSR
jgi:hypothetical protein